MTFLIHLNVEREKERDGGNEKGLLISDILPHTFKMLATSKLLVWSKTRH